MIPVREHLKNVRRVRDEAEDRGQFLRLDKNEGIMDFPPAFLEIMRREAITSGFITTYPQVAPLYRKVAEWLGCSPDNICLTMGSDAAIRSVFEVFVNPGDAVAIISPTYAMFYVYASIFQARLIEIPFKADLSLPSGDITDAIARHRPKLVCIANPNSPTGTILPSGDLRGIINDVSKRDGVILVDEAYFLYHPETVIDLINDYPNLVVTRTFSKAVGLAAARLGFAAAHPETTAYLRKVAPIYECNAFAAKLGELVLDHFEIVKRNLEEARRGKEFMERELDRLGVRYFRSYANFVLIDVGSFDRSVEIVKAMRLRRILIKGGFSEAPLRNCIRATIGSVEQMTLFIDNLKQVLAGAAGQPVAVRSGAGAVAAPAVLSGRATIERTCVATDGEATADLQPFETLRGKRVLVTGSSSGIGACTAELLAFWGARMGVHYRSNKEGAARVVDHIVARDGEARLFQGDLLDPGVRAHLLDSFVDAFGGIDVLVNNAGGLYGGHQTFLELGEEDWDHTFALNVKAPFILSRRALHYMRQQGGGRIINISSISTRYGGSPETVHNAASKAALESLTLSFSRYGAPDKILVNSIRCGFIDTPFHGRIRSEDNIRQRVMLIPLKRAGQPMDIARMVLFLASSAGDFITGEVFTVAGGD